MSTSSERGRLAENHRLNREQILDLMRCLKAKGYSNASIAHILRVPENDVRAVKPVPMPRSEMATAIKTRDLSQTEDIRIDGPWAFKGLEGFETSIYIFLPGGEKKEIGKAVARVEGGLRFEIVLEEKYKNIDIASFEVPMRFTMHQKTEGENAA